MAQDKIKRRIMRDFTIEELSAVDRPAQGGALVTLMKRDKAYGGGKDEAKKTQRTTTTTNGHTHTYDDSKSGKTSSDDDHTHPVTLNADGTIEIGEVGGHTHGAGTLAKVLTLAEKIVKRFIDPQEGLKTFDEVLRLELEDDRYWNAQSVLSPSINALETALKSIGADPNLSSDTKMATMANSMTSFLNEVSPKMPEVEAALAKGFAGDDAGDNGSAKGESDMSDAEKKQLDELQKTNEELTAQVEEITKQLDAAKEASEDATKAVELQTNLDELAAKVEELTESLEKSEAEKADAETVSKLSDAEKTFASGLDKAGREAFLLMDKAGREKAMKKSLDDDEVLKVGENEIRKSEVGDAQFAIMKSQQDEIDATRKNLATEKASREDAELSKRVETELADFAGEDAVKIDVLRAIDKMDEAPRDELLKFLEIGQKAVKAAFETVGTTGTEVTKEIVEKADAFKKHVAEIKERDSCSGQEAMQKARVEHPEEFAAYQGEDAQAN